MLERCQRETKLLEYFLRESESGSVIAFNGGEVVLEDNIAVGNRSEDLEENNSQIVVQLWIKALEVLRKMHVVVKKDIQTQMLQQRGRLDEEIDGLHNLMQRNYKNRRYCSKERKNIVKLFAQLIVGDGDSRDNKKHKEIEDQM